jgi:hypothetical protein
MAGPETELREVKPALTGRPRSSDWVGGKQEQEDEVEVAALGGLNLEGRKAWSFLYGQPRGFWPTRGPRTRSPRTQVYGVASTPLHEPSLASPGACGVDAAPSH